MIAITKNRKYELFTVFMLIFLTSSFVICNDVLPSIATIILWVLFLGILLNHSHHIVKKLFWITVILVACMGINTILCDENLRNFIILVFSYAVVLLIVSQLTWQKFRDVFIDVMKWLCIISLTGYFLYLLIPGLHGLFPVANKAGTVYSNLILYVDTTHYNRNTGMFWEPGAFQTFINLALLFEASKENPKFSNIAVFSFSVITTYSTTGYIGMIFVFVFLYLKKGTSYNTKIILMVLAVVGALLVLFNPKVNNLLLGASLSNGQSTVFGKIINLFDSGSNNRVTSASVRYNAVFEVMKAFFERPVIGYGYQGLIERTYYYTHGMNTCTFINWFAVYGLFYGLLSFGGMVRFSSKIGKGILCRSVVVMILFVITMSENYVQNAFLVSLVLYGFDNRINSTIIE